MDWKLVKAKKSVIFRNQRIWIGAWFVDGEALYTAHYPHTIIGRWSVMDHDHSSRHRHQFCHGARAIIISWRGNSY